ncbi:MAG: ABC transporter permease subunit [Aggregatilineaceae bacterium]
MHSTEPASSNLDLAAADVAVITRPPKSLWRETIERLLRKPSALVGLSLLGFLVTIAIFAPLIATHDPLAVLLDVPEEGVAKRDAPCIHLLGCPGAGDVLVKGVPGEPVTAAALSSTNSLMAAAHGKTISIWSASNGKLLMSLEHDGPVTALDWSPNDQKILAASGEELYIWDVNRRALSRTLEHEGGASLVRWNADGTRFLSADEHTVRLWDTLTWTLVAAIESPEPLLTVQWNQNGTLVLTASGSEAKLWNAFVGTEVATLTHDVPLTSASFNRSTNRILTTSGDKLYIWNASTFQRELTIDHVGALANGTWSEAISRGIQNVMASDGDTAYVWRVTTGEQMLSLEHGEPIVQMGGSPLATRIFTRSEHTIKVWDAKSGDQVLTIEREAPILQVTWQNSGGGVFVATANEISVVKTSDYQYLMGIDGNLRDQFSRVIFGARLSLMVGLTTVTLAVIIGTISGAVAGYVGGWADNVIMRIMDVMLAFPPLILAIAVVTVLGPGLINALLAISVVFIPAYARVARSGVLAVKEEDFVTADRVLGVSHARILFRRIMPNALAPLIVQATLGIGTAILDAAALSFLGLGAQPPTPEWGAMLGAERNQVFTAPHLVFYPGIAIMITVLAFNLLGDGLRDALDPRLDR